MRRQGLRVHVARAVSWSPLQATVAVQCRAAILRTVRRADRVRATRKPIVTITTNVTTNAASAGREAAGIGSMTFASTIPLPHVALWLRVCCILNSFVFFSLIVNKLRLIVIRARS